MTEEHFGQQISVAGFIGLGMNGARRHPLDSDEALHLTLYGQDGGLQTLRVAPTRDMELFQEWLRRFDRYTPSRPTHGAA